MTKLEKGDRTSGGALITSPNGLKDLRTKPLSYWGPRPNRLGYEADFLDAIARFDRRARKTYWLPHYPNLDVLSELFKIEPSGMACLEPLLDQANHYFGQPDEQMPVLLEVNVEVTGRDASVVLTPSSTALAGTVASRFSKSSDVEHWLVSKLEPLRRCRHILSGVFGRADASLAGLSNQLKRVEDFEAASGLKAEIIWDGTSILTAMTPQSEPSGLFKPFQNEDASCSNLRVVTMFADNSLHRAVCLCLTPYFTVVRITNEEELANLVSARPPMIWLMDYQTWSYLCRDNVPSVTRDDISIAVICQNAAMLIGCQQRHAECILQDTFIAHFQWYVFIQAKELRGAQFRLSSVCSSSDKMSYLALTRAAITDLFSRLPIWRANVRALAEAERKLGDRASAKQRDRMLKQWRVTSSEVALEVSDRRDRILKREPRADSAILSADALDKRLLRECNVTCDDLIRAKMREVLLIKLSDCNCTERGAADAIGRTKETLRALMREMKMARPERWDEGARRTQRKDRQP